MHGKTLIYGLVSVLALASCRSLPEPTDWQAIGGSRADGTVRVAYEKHFKQRLVRNEQQAQHIAYQRCKVWGFTGAESFGGNTRSCVERNHKGVCLIWQYVREYQCTDHHQDAAPAVQKSKDGQDNVIINLNPINK